VILPGRLGKAGSESRAPVALCVQRAKPAACLLAGIWRAPVRRFFKRLDLSG